MKLAILDRDGVINFDSDQYIKSPAEWKPIRGSIEGIARLTQAESALHRLTNPAVDLRRQGRLRGLILEGKNRHRLDRRRETTAGEAVEAAADREETKACEEPRYPAQSRPVYGKGK